MRRPCPALGRSAKKKNYLTVIAGVNFEAGVSLDVGFILPCVWLRLLSSTVPRSPKVLSLTKLPFAWCWLASFNLYRVLLHVSYRSAGLARTKSSNIVRVNTWHLSKREHSADTPHFQLPGLIRKWMLSKPDLRFMRRCGAASLDECFPTFRVFFPFQS